MSAFFESLKQSDATIYALFLKACYIIPIQTFKWSTLNIFRTAWITKFPVVCIVVLKTLFYTVLHVLIRWKRGFTRYLIKLKFKREVMLCCYAIYWLHQDFLICYNNVYLLFSCFCRGIIIEVILWSHIQG